MPWQRTPFGWMEAVPAATRGMLFMLLAGVCFTTMQGAIRYVAGSGGSGLSPFEIAFFRNFFGLLFLVPLFVRRGFAGLKTRRLGLHLLRGGMQSAGMLCFFTALTLIPISEVTALSFSAPLFAAALAVMLLGEPVRPQRLAALGFGFSGVLFIVRPGAEVVSLGAALVLGSSLAWAGSMTIIKFLSRSDSPLTMTVYAGLFMSPITLVPALFYWHWPSVDQYGWLLYVGLAGSAGQLLFAQALKVADMSAVLPLDFTRLLWASLIGYLAFAELPSLWTWIGGGMIFAAAAHITIWETRSRRRSPSGAAAPGDGR